MISIIVPVYNAKPYLKRCVESLLAQTARNLQIIFVDDGSTDDGLSVLASVRDARVEVYKQNHAGQSAARNMGLMHAKGEFIAFVDADDALAPDWCERHLQVIETVDYVQSGYNNTRLPWHRYQFTSPCMRLYRREAIEGMRFIEGMIYEDVIWSVDLWIRHLRCRQIPYGGYQYIANPDSTTAQRHPEAEKRVFEELKKRIPKASTRNKMIILYTIIRLKLHFLKS